LQKLLAQVKGDDFVGTYLVRGDYLEVTTTRHANPIHWVGAARQGVPAISCDFDREPLQEALRQLSASTGISVVVDPRALDQARQTITAEMNDVPLDTAVGLLASMADLRAVSLDNVLYVTSRAKAKELEAEKAEQAKKAASAAAAQVPKAGQ
jgi:type II secretory pathway component GspD/PulD (secretin)